ncbi:MAG: DUF2194 domain-containing protein [Lachnospiraceae bacterium]|nr:DUF2194 domain-containing protein [Lachnospiraceae bacterium]
MISRRNYFIILIVMGIIFVLFQFSQFARSAGNDFNVNKFIELELPEKKPWQQVSLTVDDNLPWGDKEYTVFVGDKGSNIGSIVTQWTYYTKRDILIADSLTDFAKKEHALPEFVIIDSTCVDFDTETQILTDMLNTGNSVILCNLPDVSVIQNNLELKSVLGIDFIKEESVTVEGIKLFAGFLLGGEEIYEPQKKEEEKRQDLELTMPWYIPTGGTKTYMVGVMDEYFDSVIEDYEFKNDYYPAIIWRKSTANGQIFCVNGDYMSTTTGLGILSAMSYELSSYQLYPVVNAQNTLVIDFPLMADENDERFNEIYSRSFNEFQTNVIWASLMALGEQNDLQFTCFMSPKYNYSDPAQPSYDEYNTLLQLFNEKDAEVGLSLEHADGITLLEKLKVDKDYYDGIENRYQNSSAFMDLADIDELDEAVKVAYVRNVRTIACDADVQLPILSYLTDDITLQSLTSNTRYFTYSKDLMLKSIETVLGYDNAKLNMSPVIWPESVDDQWENIYIDMASSLATYWRRFKVFDNTTLTESDQRVRTFLNIDSSSSIDGDVITLNVSGADGNTTWFMLRTHNAKIDEIEGATYKKVETDAYLLTVNSESVTIRLKNTQNINN